MEVEQAYSSCLKMNLEPSLLILLKMCSHILFRIDSSRDILQTNFFLSNYSLSSILSVFTFSFDLVLINTYAYGNQQHCLINKVHNYDDEVEEAVAEFEASNLKEYWFKDIFSLLKG